MPKSIIFAEFLQQRQLAVGVDDPLNILTVEKLHHQKR